jgi:hypothetical protein
MSDVFSAFAPSFCFASSSSHAQRTRLQELYRHRSARQAFRLDEKLLKKLPILEGLKDRTFEPLRNINVLLGSVIKTRGNDNPLT